MNTSTHEWYHVPDEDVGPLQYPALAPAPLGTGQPVIPGSAPRPAPGPLSPYNPIFNPIISKSDPSTQSSTSMQAQVSTGV